MTNNENPDQTAPSDLGLHCWLRPICINFYTPPHFSGEVLCYTLRRLWPSVRPCSPFPINNLSIYAQNFFKFCIHIVIGDEWYGIVNGQNPTIFDGVTALSPFKKWFLACFSFTVYDI